MVTLYLAAAVTVDHDRVLVVRRSRTERFLPCVWGVPCGKVDPGESAGEAALRELREETGLIGHIIRRLGESVFLSEWQGRPTRNVQRNFLVRPVGAHREITLPKDDQEAAWLSRDEIGQFDGIDDYNRGVIGQWLSLADQGQAEEVSSERISSSFFL